MKDNSYLKQLRYYNAGQVPAIILRKYSNLATIVQLKLGTAIYSNELFKKANWNNWMQFDCIHLLINHRSYLDKDSPIKEFDENNIWTYNRTYGVMVRSILRRANLFLSKDGQSLKD